jgi:hypothetical protein
VITQRQFKVVRPGLQQIVNRVVGVREAVGDVDNGVDFNPGDEIAFSASDTIWSGVWLTGRNGPGGMT